MGEDGIGSRVCLDLIGFGVQAWFWKMLGPGIYLTRREYDRRRIGNRETPQLKGLNCFVADPHEVPVPALGWMVTMRLLR